MFYQVKIITSNNYKIYIYIFCNIFTNTLIFFTNAQIFFTNTQIFKINYNYFLVDIIKFNYI